MGGGEETGGSRSATVAPVLVRRASGAGPDRFSTPALPVPGDLRFARIGESHPRGAPSSPDFGEGGVKRRKVLILRSQFESRWQLPSDPDVHPGDVSAKFLGLFLAKLSRLVLHPVLRFKDPRYLPEYSLRIGKAELADHPERSGVVRSTPALPGPLDRESVTSGDHAVHSEKTDGVPGALGCCSIHLSLELAGSFEIDDITGLWNDLGACHGLGLPGDVQPFGIDGGKECRISGVFRLRPGVDERGNGVPKPVPNPGPDFFHGHLDHRSVTGRPNLDEEVHIAVVSFFSPTHRAEHPSPLNALDAEGLRNSP
jgi:hypothetical protein